MRTKPERSYALTQPSLLMQKVYSMMNNIPFRPSLSTYNLTMSHEKKFIWFRVAKVGTRTIHNHFIDNDIVLDLSHPYQVYYPEKQYDSYFKFAFVRNPWDRVVSGWKDKVVGSNQLKFDEKAHRQMQDFGNFIDYLQEVGVRKGNPHFRLQSHLINLSHIDFLGRLETFSKDFSTICHHLDIPFDTIGHKNRSTREKDYRSYYDDKLIEKVAKLYQKDIQIFNYTF